VNISVYTSQDAESAFPHEGFVERGPDSQYNPRHGLE